MNQIVKVVKVSFFLPEQPEYQHPIMHLPVSWQIELIGEEGLHGKKMEIRFLEHNPLQLGEGRVIGWLDCAGKNLAVCFSGGEGEDREGLPLTVKLYTNEPRRK